MQKNYAFPPIHRIKTKKFGVVEVLMEAKRNTDGKLQAAYTVFIDQRGNVLFDNRVRYFSGGKERSAVYFVGNKETAKLLWRRAANAFNHGLREFSLVKETSEKIETWTFGIDGMYGRDY